MNVLVVGAGAVGGYFGAYLAEAGHAVTLVARGEHGRAIRAHGLTVEEPGRTLTVRAPTIEDTRFAAGGSVDLAIVAVKAASLRDVAGKLGAALAPAGLALPLLNGLDSEEVLASALGPRHVVGGIAQIAARIVAPGKIQVDAPGRLVLAPLSEDRLGETETLASVLAGAGFGCDVKRDLRRVLYTKLLWNAPFNAICAITRRSAGEVLAVPELTALVESAMREVVAVARADGVSFDESVILATIQATREKFASTQPSMLQDVLAGRETEARSLQGAIVGRGRLHGISTPVHDALLALVLGLERA